MPTLSAFLRALTALSRLRAELADLAPTRHSTSAPAAPDEANVDALESALREVIPNPDEERNLRCPRRRPRRRSVPSSPSDP